MSRSFSIIGAHMSGVRIAGELTFTPSHVNREGFLVHDRISVPVIANSRRGTNRDGSPGRRDNFRLVAWAGYARSLCKHGSVGKCLDVEVKPSSYEGTVYKMAPNPQNPAEMIPQPVVVAGQTLTTEKVAFTIVDISYGEESAKQIQRELEIYASNPQNIAGRPAQWNVMGSPDQAKFVQILDARKKMQWDGQSAYYGYARVIQPRNAQRLLNTQERMIIETQGAQALNIPLASSKRAAAVPAATAPGFATGTPAAAPADVANAFIPNPAVQPAMPAVQPVSVGNPFTQPAPQMAANPPAQTSAY
jgi:hypothetical protein